MTAESGAAGPADVTALVVSYNTRELTCECLASLDRERGDVRLQVVAVDNASSDGSARAIRERFPRVELIESDENLGFARANNLAAERAHGAWLLLVNPDAALLEDTLREVLDFARREPQRGIYGGRTVYADGSPNPGSCWGRPGLWSTFCRSFGLSAAFPRSRLWNPEGIGFWWQGPGERDVDIVSGCFFLVRRDLWQRLGGFCESFFMYGEEADFCLRARALGANPGVTAGAVLVHHGAASERVRALKQIRLHESKVRLMLRHWPAAKARAGRALLNAGVALRAGAYSVLTLLRRRRFEDDARCWREVWRQRRRWKSIDRRPVET